MLCAGRGARADAREQGITLDQHLTVHATIGRAGGPEPGDDLVEMRATNARGTLEQLQAVGHEHAQQRAVLDIEQPLDGRAVGAHALGLPRLEADAQLVLLRAVAEPHAHPSGVLPEAHQLALVARARRAPGAAEVDRLEQVRLTGAVRSVHDGQPVAQGGLGARIGAEVAQLNAQYAHDS